jgi:hypothetical protein
MGVDKGKICGKIKVDNTRVLGDPTVRVTLGERRYTTLRVRLNILTTIDFYGIMKDFDHRVTLCANGVPKEI